MAILDSLRKLRRWDEEALHFVDLCCGSAMTATFLALSAPKSTVTAVDIRPPQHLPHFHEAGIANVRYLCEDMTRPGFLEVMEKALLDVALPAIALSVVATQIYNRFPQLVLGKGGRASDWAHVVAITTRGPEERYERWAHGLAQLLPEVPVLWTSNSLEAAHWDSQQQVEVLWLLAQLRVPKTGFAAEHVQRCQENAARISEELQPADLSRLAWSLARLQKLPAATAQALAAQALPQVEAFEPADLARLAAALCRFLLGLDMSESVLQSRINELRERPILPMLVIDSMLPGQRLVFNSPNKELQVLVEEEQDIGVIGMVRSRFGTSPARHGVSATLKQVNFNQWELKALRHFKVLGPAEHDGDITRAKVEWVNDETSEEDVKLAETLVPLVDEWTATLMEMGKERYDGQLADILKDLGDMPEAKAPGQLAIWVAALVNPIPALGVAYEIRPAVLSASSVRERLEVAIEGIRGSIDHISGKRKLF
ncbi:hypothetical protein AK812_SmicGene13803 [Symbiodinium microadriaticum]|uniref:Methyltransferase domain-containing protein n=1 Tax=Symbiodinium microadriaticum TaxID=2951 RepID=A0A1Q9E765_SYMMI|nr:hypothetical protein AK812_SmicGene13803 [Symbiodinium microadriaticum]